MREKKTCSLFVNGKCHLQTFERSFYVTKGGKSTWIPIKGNMFDLWVCGFLYIFFIFATRMCSIVVHIAWHFNIHSSSSSCSICNMNVTTNASDKHMILAQAHNTTKTNNIISLESISFWLPIHFTINLLLPATEQTHYYFYMMHHCWGCWFAFEMSFSMIN